MAEPSLIRRFTNALGITTPEPQAPSPAERAQRERDERARTRFATTGQELDKPEVIPVAMLPRTPRATKAELPPALKKQYQDKWQEVLQNEDAKDAYGKLKDLGTKIASISGNKKESELTDADFKAFGMSKDQYNTVLSRVAMKTAVSTFKGLVDHTTSDLYKSMQDLEGMLADTEYAKKGGMKHAREVLLSVSGTNIPVAGYDELKSVIGREAAYRFGDNYKNSIAGQYAQVPQLLAAIKMGGEELNDQTIRKYTGESKEQFEEKMREKLMDDLPRGGGDRHFDMYMSLTGRKPGKGLFN